MTAATLTGPVLDDSIQRLAWKLALAWGATDARHDDSFQRLLYKSAVALGAVAHFSDSEQKLLRAIAIKLGVQAGASSTIDQLLRMIAGHYGVVENPPTTIQRWLYKLIDAVGVPPTPPPPPPVLPGKATGPDPLNASSGNDPAGLDFFWTDGAGSVTVKMYLDGVLVLTQAAGIGHANMNVQSYASHTWRIDSINADGTTTGDTWTFDTGGQADAADWVTRATANAGEAPALATKRAISDFCTGMAEDGLNLKMITLIFLPPSTTLEEAITPVYATAGYDPWANSEGNFDIGMMTVNGLLGGSFTALDTGFYPATGLADDTSFGLTIYVSQPNFASDNLDTGATEGGAAKLAMLVTRDGSPVKTDWDCWNNTIGQGRAQFSNPSPGFAGYYSGNRTAANASAIYLANSTTPHYAAASIATTGGTRPNNTITFFAANLDGIFGGFSSNRLSFCAVHKGLTAAESAAFFARIQALRMALGGGYV